MGAFMKSIPPRPGSFVSAQACRKDIDAEMPFTDEGLFGQVWLMLLMQSSFWPGPPVVGQGGWASAAAGRFRAKP